MKLFNNSKVLVGGIMLSSAVFSQAVVTITNGDFELQSGTFNDVAGWFDSSTGDDFADYVFTNAQVGGDTALLFEDPGNFVYQSLGTIDGSEIAAGTFVISGTAIKRDSRLFANDVTFELFAGTATAPGDSTPLTGVSSLGTFIVDDAPFDGIAQFNGSAVEASFTSTDFDVSGLTAGTEIWLQISAPSATGGSIAPALDDLSIASVPEPSTQGFFGILALLMVANRRRK